MANWSAKGVVQDPCLHPQHLREQRYPHGWFCGGCTRFFFGSVTDAEPQKLAPRDKERAAIHNRLKAEVAAQMLAKGLTPPQTIC